MSALTFSAKLTSRVLHANTTNTATSQWFIGTTALREENEIRVLEYDPDRECLQSVQSWAHPEEVWDIATHPSSPGTLITVHSSGSRYAATLWQCSTAGVGLQELHPQAQLPHAGIVRRALWHPRMWEVVLTVEENALRRWDMSHEIQCVSSSSVEGDGELWTGAVHPTQPDLAATAAGNGIQLWDVNNMTQVGAVADAHHMPVRDVDWASHNPHRLVSGGGDCKLHFWDTRLLARPEAVLELGGHSHWVWKACHNPHYDQLLISSSSDATVCLWYTPQLERSSGGGAATAATSSRRAPREVDGKVHSYDEHEDSVYGLAWSAADPWMFASLSYDGRVVVNRVPKSTKYRILV